LPFERKEGRRVDRETGSVWDALHGRAVEGPQKGAQLRPIPGIVSFTGVWNNFHPTTTTWTTENEDGER
ncbi:MAG: DUF3179 domain-containing protein, partial [Planctomycetes bacterium]|nr:DUF3179 domain-containing protein [Planctomycetota bacterium]